MRTWLEAVAWAFLTIVLSVVAMWVMVNVVWEEPPPKSHIASAETKRLMQYHGVHTTYEEGGKLYFNRNGRRCELK